MFHTRKASAVIALGCVMAAATVAGCDDSDDDAALFGKSHQQAPINGTKKIKVDGYSVNVSCSGHPSDERPLIMLMAGHGDGLTKLAKIQKRLGKKDRVCSYDRLGEGASDKPHGPQTYADSGKILTGVLDRVAGDHPVVLAGHSMGGAVAARYAPAHRERVKGLVLIDATPPTTVADTTKLIPKKAKGVAGQVRAQMVAVSHARNKEMLKATDSKVRSAGNIPVEILRHGKKYLAAVPKYGPTLERIWTSGQRKWLALSPHSHLTVAEKSTHYIYVDQPGLTVQKIRQVAKKAEI